jgi:hypothetical protein
VAVAGLLFNTIVNVLTSRAFAASTDVPFRSSLNNGGAQDFERRRLKT